MFPSNYMPICYMQTRPRNPKFTGTQEKSRYPQRGGPPEAAHPFVEAARGRLLDFPGVSVNLGFWGRVCIQQIGIYFQGNMPRNYMLFFICPLRPLTISQHQLLPKLKLTRTPQFARLVHIPMNLKWVAARSQNSEQIHTRVD